MILQYNAVLVVPVVVPLPFSSSFFLLLPPPQLRICVSHFHTLTEMVCVI